MQKASPGLEQAGGELQEKGKDVSKLLSSFGGFNAIRSFMPDADNMNPARKAAKDVFLKDKRFKDKRAAPGSRNQPLARTAQPGASRALQAMPMPASRTRRNTPVC